MNFSYMFLNPDLRLTSRFTLMHFLLFLVLLLPSFPMPLFGQNDQPAVYKVRWEDQSWQAGSRYQIMHLSSDMEEDFEQLLMSIDVQTEAKGSFSASGSSAIE